MKKYSSWGAIVGLAVLSCGCSAATVPAEEDDAAIVPTKTQATETATTADDSATTGDPDDGMTVVFEDDFEGDSSVPDPTKWVLCERSTSNWARYLSESYNQAYQKDGYLYLVGEMVDGEYKTAGIETRGKFDFEYGTVTCRARFERMAQGGHSGIWMMPAPPAEQWPKSGEIDIMEHLNKDDIVYETVHSWYADDMGHKDNPKAQATADIDNTDWNIYGVRWTPDEITYTVNGKDTFTYPNLHLDGQDGAYQWPFAHPFYIILSQSLSGQGTWAGPIDDSQLPVVMVIDWIKVAQHEEAAGLIDPTI